MKKAKKMFSLGTWYEVLKTKLYWRIFIKKIKGFLSKQRNFDSISVKWTCPVEQEVTVFIKSDLVHF